MLAEALFQVAPGSTDKILDLLSDTGPWYHSRWWHFHRNKPLVYILRAVSSPQDIASQVHHRRARIA